MSAQIQLDVAVRAAALGHSPTWDAASESLLWVDVLTNTVHRTTTEADHTLEVPQQVSAAKPRSRGGLVLNLAEGIALFEANGERRTWLVYWARAGMRGAATAVDARGRLWASTARPDESGGGWLARVESDGAARVVVDSVAAGNGVAWSPDGALMYLVDSATRRIDVLDFDLRSGEATGRRPLAELTDTTGQPAGLCTDVDGCLWVAIRDGAEIRRYTPGGGLDRTIALPARRPTDCCFGGPDLTDLYVTSARDGLADPWDEDGGLLVLGGIAEGLRTPAFTG